MSAIKILKKAMSVPYCSGTRFDYLDPEEVVMIKKAMKEYAKERRKPKPKRKPSPAGVLNLTQEELKEIEAIIGRRNVNRVVVGCGRLFYYMAGYIHGEPLEHYKAVEYILERFEL